MSTHRLSPSDLTGLHGPLGGHRIFLPDGEPVEVSGRVVATRDAGEAAIDLADAFGAVRVRGEIELEHGDLVSISGVWRAGEVVEARVVGRRSTSGVSETGRLRDGGLARKLAARARIAASARARFTKAGFIEVETPIAVPSPGLDLHLDAFSLSSERFLITSPEYQMKRLLVGGVPRCFQLARCFRRSEIGSNHNPEFTMLEWYRVNEDMDAMIADTEALLRDAVAAASDASMPERGHVVVLDRRVDVMSPFERITVAQAFRDLGGVDEEAMLQMANDDEDAFFRVLVDSIEPKLRERPVPVVLHRYPAIMGSLARLAADDKRYAERFEVYVGGLELSNGFVELTDPVEQRERLERDQRERAARGKPVYPIDERFIAALHEGMPDAAGNALGFDRLVMLATGASSLAEVCAYPEGSL